MTKLAHIISKCEGFGVPGAIPTIFNNPGDLRHSPHSSHEGEAPDDIGKIDSAADGWADLERQLKLDAARGMTLQEFVYTYAPPADGNNSAAYLKTVCDGLGLPPEATVAQALLIQA